LTFGLRFGIILTEREVKKMFYRYKGTLYSLDNVRKVQTSTDRRVITIEYTDGGSSNIGLGGSEQEAITVLDHIAKKLNGR
jgi:hypothetical protein